MKGKKPNPKYVFRNPDVVWLNPGKDREKNFKRGFKLTFKPKGGALKWNAQRNSWDIGFEIKAHIPDDFRKARWTFKGKDYERRFTATDEKCEFVRHLPKKIKVQDIVLIR